MSLFEGPQLKQEAITFSGAELELYELSAYDRCEYLERTTGSIAMPKDGEVQAPEFENLGQLWAFRREDTDSKLLLVAYALKPGREESLKDLHNELRCSVPMERIDELYIPAAKLSGLHAEPAADQEIEEEEESGEDGAKKG